MIKASTRKRWQCTRRTLSIRLKKLGDDHPDVADTYNNMAVVYRNQGKYEEALAMHEKALSIYLKKLGDDHPDVADTYNNMAGVYDKQGKYEEALAMYEKALSIRLKKLGDDHPMLDVAIRTITWL